MYKRQLCPSRLKATVHSYESEGRFRCTLGRCGSTGCPFSVFYFLPPTWRKRNGMEKDDVRAEELCPHPTDITCPSALISGESLFPYCPLRGVGVGGKKRNKVQKLGCRILLKTFSMWDYKNGQIWQLSSLSFPLKYWAWFGCRSHPFWMHSGIFSPLQWSVLHRYFMAEVQQDVIPCVAFHFKGLGAQYKYSCSLLINSLEGKGFMINILWNLHRMKAPFKVSPVCSSSFCSCIHL